MSDRTVHARDVRGGIEIVRYERAEKWYVEIAEHYGRHGLPAERIGVTVAQAADHARFLEKQGGEVFFGLHGGRAFERLVTA